MTYDLNDYTPLEKLVRQYEVNGTFSNQKWQKQAKASIIVSVYNQEEQLRKQLLALSQQTYNLNNLEIIIVDDGGKKGTGSCMDIVAKTELPFDVKYIWQPKKGFRLAKARNEALKKARYENVICLDADMIPAHNYIESVMKTHYAAKKYGVGIITVQDRAFVEPENMPDELIAKKQLSQVKKSVSRRFGTIKDWRKKYYDSTNRLKNIPDSVEDPTYSIGAIFSGGNCSFSRADAFEVGLFDEDFTQYGAEDTEFGIRLYEHFNCRLNEKRFLVPIEATAYHLEHGKKMESQMPQKSQNLFWKKVKKNRTKTVTSRPEVSVYIPCYNQKKFIENTITSIARQKDFDLSKLEVVIGEDNSNDGTKEILKELQHKYQKIFRIRIIDDGKNHGMAENTNRTIQSCRGKYILQLDADDELLPNAVQTLYQVLKKNPHASLAFGDCLDRDTQTGKISPHWSCEEFTSDWYKTQGENIGKKVLDILREGMRVHPPRMFKREAFFKTEGVAPTLENAVDYDLYLKLSETGIPIHKKEHLHIYNTNHSGNTSNKRELQIANGEIVKRTSLQRELTKKRKEFYILKEEEKSSRTEHFNFVDPNLRLNELYKVWQTRENTKKGTPLSNAIIQELERLVRFFRWVDPETARGQLDLLRKLEPENSLGQYYHATYLHGEGRLKEALKELNKLNTPSARSLEEKILNDLQVNILNVA